MQVSASHTFLRGSSTLTPSPKSKTSRPFLLGSKLTWAGCSERRQAGSNVFSSTDWQEVRQEEQVREAVRAREQAAERELAREQGLQSVMDWERAKMKRFTKSGVGKKGAESGC